MSLLLNTNSLLPAGFITGTNTPFSSNKKPVIDCRLPSIMASNTESSLFLFTSLLLSAVLHTASKEGCRHYTEIASSFGSLLVLFLHASQHTRVSKKKKESLPSNNCFLWFDWCSSIITWCLCNSDTELFVFSGCLLSF